MTPRNGRFRRATRWLKIILHLVWGKRARVEGAFSWKVKVISKVKKYIDIIWAVDFL